MPVKQLLSYGSSKKGRKPPVIHETPLYLCTSLRVFSPVRQTASAISGLLWPPGALALPEKAARVAKGLRPQSQGCPGAPNRRTGGGVSHLRHICSCPYSLQASGGKYPRFLRTPVISPTEWLRKKLSRFSSLSSNWYCSQACDAAKVCTQRRFGSNSFSNAFAELVRVRLI